MDLPSNLFTSRVQVPNHILTQNLDYDYLQLLEPKTQVPNYWVHGHSGLLPHPKGPTTQIIGFFTIIFGP